MIREMTPERLRGIQPDSEAATKLLALTEAYGLECPFVRYWEGEGRLAAALMEGRLTLFSPEDIGEETALFISMQPEIRCLRTDRASAEPAWLSSARLAAGNRTGDAAGQDVRAVRLRFRAIPPGAVPGADGLLPGRITCF